MAEDDPVLAVTSVINITDKKVRGQHNIALLQLSVSQTKKVRGQHNITNTVDSLHMDEISLHENLRPVGPVVRQNILIPKKITGPNQGPILGLIAVKWSTYTYGSPWYITTTYN